MIINELIEQIGGRERLEEIAADGFLKHGESKLIACALLAVLDAQEIPVAFYANDAYYNTESAALKDGAEEVMPLYTTPPTASVPEGYKLVPIEPSKEMLLASKRYKAKNKVPTGPGVYRAMIAAAPAPGGDAE